MTGTQRQLIEVDQDKCNGCGACMPACPEGALALVNGKAQLVRQSFCDGLGACLGDCPQGALRVVVLEADAYDEAGVLDHLGRQPPALLEKHMAHLAGHGLGTTGAAAEVLPLHPAAALGSRAAAVAGCPSAAERVWAPEEAAGPLPVVSGADAGRGSLPVRGRSELRQWPVQLHLVPPDASFLQGADLLLVADCVPFAYPNFHADLLAGHALVVGCPKLDDPRAYLEKLTQILRQSDLRSLTVVHMEVPCCRGLVVLAQRALEVTGRDIPFEGVVVSVQA